MDDADYISIGKAFSQLSNADIYRICNLLNHATLVHNKSASQLYRGTCSNFRNAVNSLIAIRSSQQVEMVE